MRGSISIDRLTKESALKHFDLVVGKPTIFVTGGSLGASAINKAIAYQIELLESKGIQLIWQCGKFYEEEYKKYDSKQVKVLSFIDRMDCAYAAADIIISRAGGTISELAIIAKPTILLPSPNVSEDHQTKNVIALVEKDAAVLIKDINANEQLVPNAIALLEDKNQQEKLSRNIKLFAKPNAANEIAQTILGQL